MVKPVDQPVRIALIGSRDLHKIPGYDEDIHLLHRVCYRLACLGIRFTSGLCEKGMDEIAQVEFSRALDEGKATPDQFEVYIYKRKRNTYLPHPELARLRNPQLLDQLEAIASKIHGGWHNCEEYARGQHTRNVHQILGYNLDEPVKAVVTWCKVSPRGEPLGGTRTAILLAKQHGIPVINLHTLGKEAFLAQIQQLLIHEGVIKE